MPRRSLPALSLAFAVFILCPAPASAAATFAPGQVVVIVRDESGVPRGASLPDALHARLAVLGLEHDRVIAASSARRAWSLHRLRSAVPGFDPVAAAAELRAMPGVIAAIPNYRLELSHTFPNDPMRSLQWSVDSGDSADI